MREAGFGRIVFIGSGYAKRSGGGLAYTTAKHGLIGMTRALAAATARQGDITVNCLCPGWTNTVLIGDKYIERDPDKPPNPIFNQKSHDASARENLQNRILEPEELGPMALLLALPKSKGITGQVISVDGGYKI